MANTSTLRETLPAKVEGWNNLGGIYVYQVAIDTINTDVTIRSSITTGFRQVIVGWSHSITSDHTITFDLGDYSITDAVLARTRYGLPLSRHAMFVGKADTAIAVQSSVILTAVCYVLEVTQIQL